MPTYRYSGPRDTEPHVVVEDSFERDGETVMFVNVISFDGEPHTAGIISVISPGDIEIID
jgi:hypothetical protein